jgi:hypothetical protein
MEPFVKLLIEQRYPNFFLILGLMVIVSFVLGLSAIISIFFDWKLALALAAMGILLRLVGNFYMKIIINSVLNK